MPLSRSATARAAARRRPPRPRDLIPGIGGPYYTAQGGAASREGTGRPAGTDWGPPSYPRQPGPHTPPRPDRRHDGYLARRRHRARYD